MAPASFYLPINHSCLSIFGHFLILFCAEAFLDSQRILLIRGHTFLDRNNNLSKNILTSTSRIRWQSCCMYIYISYEQDEIVTAFRDWGLLLLILVSDEVSRDANDMMLRDATDISFSWVILCCCGLKPHRSAAQLTGCSRYLTHCSSHCGFWFESCQE